MFACNFVNHVNSPSSMNAVCFKIVAQSNSGNFMLTHCPQCDRLSVMICTHSHTHTPKHLYPNTLARTRRRRPFPKTVAPLATENARLGITSHQQQHHFPTALQRSEPTAVGEAWLRRPFVLYTTPTAQHTRDAEGNEVKTERIDGVCASEWRRDAHRWRLFVF